MAAASQLLPFALGRVAAGGVYLTPSGIEHRFGVRTAYLPWDGFELPNVGVPFSLRNPLGPTETKSFPYDIPIDVTDRVRGGVAAPTPYLALKPDHLVALLAMYAGRPRRQEHLGTTRSLEWQPWSHSEAVLNARDRHTDPYTYGH